MQNNIMVSAGYAAFFTLFLLLLALRVIQLRRSLLVGIGDGHKSELRRAIAAHQNAVENIPVALILMALYEFNRGSVVWLHICALVFLVGRLLNAWGVSRHNNQSIGRFYGMLMTVASMTTLALLNVVMLFQ